MITATSPAPICCPLEIEQAGWMTSPAGLPELPDAKKARFMADFGLSDYDASVLTAEAWKTPLILRRRSRGATARWPRTG